MPIKKVPKSISLPPRSLENNKGEESIVKKDRLPGEDSNLKPQLQGLVCYHYTTGHNGQTADLNTDHRLQTFKDFVNTQSTTSLRGVNSLSG